MEQELAIKLQENGIRRKVSGATNTKIRSGRFGRIQLPGEREARYWLQQWREGAELTKTTQIRKIFLGKNRDEVR